MPKRRMTRNAPAKMRESEVLKNLSPEELKRREGIDLMLKDFNKQVDARIAEMDADMESTIKSIHTLYKVELIKLPSSTKNMKWNDYVSQCREDGSYPIALTSVMEKVVEDVTSTVDPKLSLMKSAIKTTTKKASTKSKRSSRSSKAPSDLATPAPRTVRRNKSNNATPSGAGSVPAALGRTPFITPRFNTATPLSRTVSRVARPNETLVSLSGSPVVTLSLKGRAAKAEAEGNALIPLGKGQTLGNNNRMEKKGKMWTPAGEKLSKLGVKFVLAAPASFFQAAKDFLSLGRDIDRLVEKGLMSKITVEGEGLILTQDIHSKCSDGDWDSEAVLVLVIDGVEVGTSADLVATILNMSVAGKKTLLVAGPASEKTTEQARNAILDKMDKSVATALDMSQAAKKSDPDGKITPEQEGVWSPVAASYLLTMIAWWVDGFKSGQEQRENPIICVSCGCVHEEDRECLKKEILKPKVHQKNKDEDRNKEEKNNNRVCNYCPKRHPGTCWYGPHGSGGQNKRFKKGE